MLYKIKYSVQQELNKLYIFVICDGTQTLNISWNLAITERDKNIALIQNISHILDSSHRKEINIS